VPDGDGTEPDGTMVDCMGFAQPVRRRTRLSLQTAPGASSTSPKLRTGSPSCIASTAATRWQGVQAQPLARGIEVFKVVYGHDG
jgi:type IV pilus assembly protein PilW